jgi:uncharacterized LabA/DUF88 family protein
MATSSDVTSMALFCDFENVALGVRETHHEKFDIKLVLERLLLKGSIVVKKAYCDWDRYKGFKAQMHEASFELIEIPHVRQSGKNSADIRLVVDALDLCYTKSHVNTFVIISGDSDFSPLVSKLRENNKQVIGVGVKESTSDLLIANCDEFIFYDDLVRESGRQSSRREARPAPPPSRRPATPSANPEDDRRRDEADNRKNKAVELALQTFEALYSERGDGGKIWASVLKEAIKRRKPDFSESYYGFRSFGGAARGDAGARLPGDGPRREVQRLRVPQQRRRRVAARRTGSRRRPGRARSAGGDASRRRDRSARTARPRHAFARRTWPQRARTPRLRADAHRRSRAGLAALRRRGRRRRRRALRRRGAGCRRAQEQLQWSRRRRRRCPRPAPAQSAG